MIVATQRRSTCHHAPATAGRAADTDCDHAASVRSLANPFHPRNVLKQQINYVSPILFFSVIAMERLNARDSVVSALGQSDLDVRYYGPSRNFKLGANLGAPGRHSITRPV